MGALTVLIDFWREFPRSLRDRGLKIATETERLGVTLVTSHAHVDLSAAGDALLPGGMAEVAASSSPHAPTPPARSRSTR
ncbi:hypothetical protein [Microbacterium aurum]